MRLSLFVLVSLSFAALLPCPASAQETSPVPLSPPLPSADPSLLPGVALAEGITQITESRVVYAAESRFSAVRLEREGMRFKQTPYAIHTR